MLHVIINRGVKEYHDAEERRQINMLNISSAISVAFNMVFIIINISTHNWIPIISNFLLLTFNTSVFFINKLKYHTFSIYTLVLLLGAFFTVNAILLHNNLQYGIFLCMAFTILIINNKTGRIIMLAILILFFITYILLQDIRGLAPPQPKYKSVIGAVAFLLVFSVILEYFKERLVQYHRRLAVINEQLKESNRIKEKMLSILSHDFYGPVGNLITSMDMLNEHLFTPEEFQSTSHKLKMQLQVLSTSMKDVLQWSKMQMQGEAGEKNNIDLYEVFDEIVRLLETPLQEKKLQLQNSVPKNTTAYANKDDVKLIFRNLVSNAIKFSNHNGSIIICTEANGKTVKISIADEGTGIPQNVLHSLRSEQLSFFSTPGTAKEKGTGIGLMLVREFIHKNNGTLSIKSQEGEGSIFSVTLPLVSQS